MCIAVAIIGGAVLGAAGSAIAGHEAASATKDATNASITAQENSLNKVTALNAPYAAIGTGTGGSGGAIQQYQNLLGIGGPGQPSPQATLEATPGYQFEKSQGLDATKAAASAMGLTLSGNTLEGLDKFSTGLADTTFQQAVGNAQNAVTIGQNAAAGTGAATLQTGQGISGALINQGNTLAGIDANTIAGITKSIGNAGNQYIFANTLAGLGGTGGGSGVPSANYWSDVGANDPGFLPTVGDIPGVTGAGGV